ncbi:HTH domain-containing protein [Niallia sp. MER TA 168]|nr:HTH domain-containing protein [Niallia sp. MER TA 168]
MNERHQMILNILRKEKCYVTAAELAEVLEVSKKTIYRDIQQIIDANSMPFRIIKKENFGYYLENNKKILESETTVFDYPDERRLNLLLFLLSIAPCKTSIQKISEKYIVSQSSILNDFKHIEKELMPYNLRLIRTNEGTFIKGDKLSIYRLMAVIIEKYLTQMGDPFSQYDIPDSIKKVKVKNNNLLKIKKLLHDIQVQHDLSLDQPYYLTLFCSLLSIIEKQRNKLILNEEVVFEEIDNNASIYYVCKDLVDDIEKCFSIQLKAYDIYSLYYILKAHKLNSRFLLNQDTEHYQNEQVILLANRLIARVTENSWYQFDTDDELFY